MTENVDERPNLTTWGKKNPGSVPPSGSTPEVNRVSSGLRLVLRLNSEQICSVVSVTNTQMYENVMWWLLKQERKHTANIQILVLDFFCTPSQLKFTHWSEIFTTVNYLVWFSSRNVYITNDIFPSAPLQSSCAGDGSVLEQGFYCEEVTGNETCL